MGALAATPGVLTKVIETDLRTHVVQTLEGPRDFYGHPLDEHGLIGPQVMVSTLHPDDQERFIEIAERSETLRPGEELRYELRVRHRDGYWVLAKCRSVPKEWDYRGFVVVIRSEVEMVPYSSGLPI
ncbi:MAG TPA: PAS domain-containing protein [Fimbriimonas sp.]